jgi:hypothetical protein
VSLSLEIKLNLDQLTTESSHNKFGVTIVHVESSYLWANNIRCV